MKCLACSAAVLLLVTCIEAWPSSRCVRPKSTLKYTIQTSSECWPLLATFQTDLSHTSAAGQFLGRLSRVLQLVFPFLTKTNKPRIEQSPNLADANTVTRDHGKELSLDITFSCENSTCMSTCLIA